MLISMILADDHELILESLASLLSEVPDFEIIGKCRNGRELLECVESLRPDVVVVDIAMPELNGIEAVRQIRKISPATRIIALSLFTEKVYIRKMINAGASGYVIKGGTTSELIKAIRTGSRRNIYFCSEIAGKAARIKYSKYKVKPKFLPSERPLTIREKEVLQLIGEGHTSEDIASKLKIGKETVKTHRRNLMDKLNVHDVAGLTRNAIRLKLVHIE